MCCLYSLRTLFVSLLWAISFYSHVPLWQMSPPPFNNFIINYDFQDAESAQVRSRFMEQLGHGVFGPVFEADFPLNTALRNTAIRVEDHQAYHEALVDWDHGDADDDTGGAVNNNPHCFIYEPIYKTINDPKSETVGHTMAYIAWDKYIVDLLPEGVNNITVVLRNSCEQAFTYDLRGNSVSDGPDHPTRARAALLTPLQLSSKSGLLHGPRRSTQSKVRPHGSDCVFL